MFHVLTSTRELAMHNWTGIVLSMILLTAFPGCADRATHTPAAMSPETSLESGSRLARQFLIVDTHVDIPNRLDQRMEDISVRTRGGDFDYPRAREGGLDAPFMSIYVSASYQESGGAKEYADKLIDMVERLAADHPDLLRRDLVLLRRWGRGATGQGAAGRRWCLNHRRRWRRC